MLQKSARLQYALLALAALLALTHFYMGAKNNYRSLAHGQLRARLPFYDSYYGPFVAQATPEALASGLHNDDTVLAVNGLPYTGTTVLLQQVRQSRPGQPLAITYRRGQSPPATTAILLHAERDAPASLVAWVLHFAFLLIALLCLLVGIYVVFARPRSLFAWLIFGILAYFDPLFIASAQLDSHFRFIAQLWSDTAQTAMPLCLMAFGIYFPERSVVDTRFPWIKWLIAIPILLFLPLDLVYIYGHGYHFAASSWLDPWFYRIAIMENVFSALAISYFFANLAPKFAQSTGDARRRLRILYFGSVIGLTPAFVLFIVSLVQKTDFGQDVNNWIMVPVLAALLLFPLSLAYVVIVQRAMDVSILVRQGTRYFFARQSVWIIRLALASWFFSALIRAVFDPARRTTFHIVELFAIFALFYAFRHFWSAKLQQKIDRRFFREAYSTEQILSELSDEVRNFTEVAPLLTTITQRIGDTLHIDRIAVFLRTGDTYRLQLATGSLLAPGSLALSTTFSAISKLTHSRRPEPVYRDASGWLFEASDHERAALSNLSAELLVPLPGRHRLAGVIALGPKRSEQPYSKADRHLLQTVASQAGLALENAELLQNLTTEVAQRERVSREIEIAREVQERLFPQSCPQVPGVDLAGYCRPAQAVGGDYFDYFVLPSSPDPTPPDPSSSDDLSPDPSSSDDSSPDPSSSRPSPSVSSPFDPSSSVSSPSGPMSFGNDGRLALALGDISGKGISAALLMASLRASLRSIAGLQQGDLAGLIHHVNNLVYESSTSNRYATFFYAEYDPSTHLLSYVNAGHNPPAILRGTQSIPLPATGTVVGLFPNAEYAQATILMHPGDVLLAYTDGISEAMTRDNEEWGEDRMIATARQLLAQPSRTHTARQLLDGILQAADKFTAGAPQQDDMTLLVCTIT